MCGIFGYIGKKNNASDIVLAGLKRLDYRGYDSWGIAVADSHIAVEKNIGKIGEITSLELPEASVAIAHTRWATTGSVTKLNAHPHLSSDKSFALCQNGIVENYEELKKQLAQKGYPFVTETDTEVIVRLIEDKLKESDLKTAICVALSEIKGRNTIIILTQDGKIYAGRNGSPLVIGLNKQTNEVYFSSDTLSFAPYANEVVILDNGQLAIADATLTIFDMETRIEVPVVSEPIHLASQSIDKKGFEHFMLKEIYDTPDVIEAIINQDNNKLTDFANEVKKAHRVYTIGSGTAGVAAAQFAFYLRKFGQINAVSLIGADAKEYISLINKDDLVFAPSQSGETADVLEVLEQLDAKGVKIASLVNMPGSMMTRMSDFKFMNNAGAEIAVMSTKVFTSQISFGYLISKIIQGKHEEGRKQLQVLSKTVSEYLADDENLRAVRSVAAYLSGKHDIFLLGKYQDFQIVKEGMVKIIEGSYKHAHTIPAGDLKHYAITLMEKGVPVIAVISQDSAKSDVLNAVNEVRVRGAEVIAIASKNDAVFDRFLKIPESGETSAIMHVLPLQLISYYMALTLGNDIDKPRNIAKSVTVR